MLQRGAKKRKDNTTQQNLRQGARAVFEAILNWSYFSGSALRLHCILIGRNVMYLVLLWYELVIFMIIQKDQRIGRNH